MGVCFWLGKPACSASFRCLRGWCTNAHHASSRRLFRTRTNLIAHHGPQSLRSAPPADPTLKKEIPEVTTFIKTKAATKPEQQMKARGKAVCRSIVLVLTCCLPVGRHAFNQASGPRAFAKGDRPSRSQARPVNLRFRDDVERCPYARRYRHGFRMRGRTVPQPPGAWANAGRRLSRDSESRFRLRVECE